MEKNEKEIKDLKLGFKLDCDVYLHRLEDGMLKEILIDYKDRKHVFFSNGAKTAERLPELEKTGETKPEKLKPSTMIKLCPDCGIEKPVTDFYKDKIREDGLRWRCKECDHAYRKEWERKNKEKKESTSTTRNGKKFVNDIIKKLPSSYALEVSYKPEVIKDLSQSINEAAQTVYDNKEIINFFKNCLHKHMDKVSMVVIRGYIAYFIEAGMLTKKRRGVGFLYEINRDMTIPKANNHHQMGFLEKLGLKRPE